MLFLLPAIVVSSLAAAGCYAASGRSLGLFLGGPVFLAILLPPLAAAAGSARRRIASAAAAVLPFLITWIVATLLARPDASIGNQPGFYIHVWGDCLAAALILVAWAFALLGIVTLLTFARLGPMWAAAIAIALALAALTWPIWMSRAWNGTRSADRVAPWVAIHPGLAINGAVVQQHGVWMEQSVAYGLTDLGQNVPFALPGSILQSVLFHVLLGGVCIGIASLRRRRKADPAQRDAVTTT